MHETKVKLGCAMYATCLQPQLFHEHFLTGATHLLPGHIRLLLLQLQLQLTLKAFHILGPNDFLDLQV